MRKAGILTGIVTGENVSMVKRRADKLKLDFCECGIKDKLACVMQICNKNKISMKNVAYVGDDINDLRLIESVGFGCCVNNADDKIKQRAKYITKKNGGEGAVREVIDLILQYQR